MTDASPRHGSQLDELIAPMSSMSVNESNAIIDPADSSTIYMPIVSPPTPAPSPRPLSSVFSAASNDVAHHSRLEFASLKSAGFAARQQYIAALLADCTPAELLFVSTTIAPLLKRDFLRDLPIELSLHILGYIDDARTLGRASRVSRFWNVIMRDEATWKRLCSQAMFEDRLYPNSEVRPEGRASPTSTSSSLRSMPLLDGAAQAVLQELPPEVPLTFSHRKHFIQSYKTSGFTFYLESLLFSYHLIHLCSDELAL